MLLVVLLYLALGVTTIAILLVEAHYDRKRDRELMRLEGGFYSAAEYWIDQTGGLR